MKELRQRRLRSATEATSTCLSDCGGRSLDKPPQEVCDGSVILKRMQSIRPSMGACALAVETPAKLRMTPAFVPSV